MNDMRKTLIIVGVAVALAVAGWSAWSVFGPGASADDHMKTVAGPINHMSSMLGPDASGKPRTDHAQGEQPVAGQTGQRPAMGRMMGPSGYGRQGTPSP